MSGRYVKLDPGRYTLDVSSGEGPAGVRRGDGREDDVALDIDGGRIDFFVAAPEQAFYWWRGPSERPGVRLLGVTRRGLVPSLQAARPSHSPTGTDG